MQHWPANSLDMNIIENIWSIIVNKLLNFTMNNVDELINALQTDISKETVGKPFESLPECVQKVINCKGFLVIHKYFFFV